MDLDPLDRSSFYAQFLEAAAQKISEVAYQRLEHVMPFPRPGQR